MFRHAGAVVNVLSGNGVVVFEQRTYAEHARDVAETIDTLMHEAARFAPTDVAELEQDGPSAWTLAGCRDVLVRGELRIRHWNAEQCDEAVRRIAAAGRSML